MYHKRVGTCVVPISLLLLQQIHSTCCDMFWPNSQYLLWVPWACFDIVSCYGSLSLARLIDKWDERSAHKTKLNDSETTGHQTTQPR